MAPTTFEGRTLSAAASGLLVRPAGYAPAQHRNLGQVAAAAVRQLLVRRSGKAGRSFRSTRRQENTQSIDKWQQPLSRAVPVPRPAPGGCTHVPYDTAQVIFNTVTIDKWLVGLSTAVPWPKVPLGSSFVPFDTAQVVAAVYG